MENTEITNILSVSTKVPTYNIEIENSFDGLKKYVDENFPNLGKILLITDSNVYKIYADEVKSLFQKEVIEYVLIPGEKSKSLEYVNEIWEKMYEENLHRTDLIIGLGGGVVGDFSGFVAATYLRGIPFISCPTTLLSMCDSSLGGKTGVDYKDKKNLIGAFRNPSHIYVNINTLNTLPDREFFAGFAEIMKGGLLANSKFYTWLIDNMYEICEKDENVLKEMVISAIGIKKAIVEKDPFETLGDRMLLNLGHTIGHGIESVLGDEYIHGECVALGCVAASYISYKMGFIKSDDYYEIRDMFVPFYLPISIETNKTEEIFEAVKYDKKNSSQKFRMVLIKRVGKAFVCDDVPEQLIKEAIAELNFKEED